MSDLPLPKSSTPQVAEPVFMMGVEQRLVDDVQGVERDRILTYLRNKRAEFHRAQRYGSDPCAFKSMAAMQTALDNAIAIVEILWNVHHSARN